MSIESSAQLPSPTHEAQPPSPAQPQLSTMAAATMVPSVATNTSSTSASLSAPEIHTRRPLSANSITASPSLDAVSLLSPRSAPPDALIGVAISGDVASASHNSDPDPQILEALRSKDRIYVLKLGEMMEGLINERRLRIDLNPTTSYQRLLVYRCSAYYKLSPESDNSSKNIFVYCRSESRIPAQRISELVPLEESAQPAFKIMRRSVQDGTRGRYTSQAGSVTGEDGELSDMEPSETNSIGGRSNTTASSKRHLTMEERAAAYNEARSRIFMDFEEKEKEKEKDMSANSSTFSVNSGSASTSGGRAGSISDLDDSASSAPTESEWSGPVTFDQWDGRHSGGSSSRSRTSYNNGSGSSRNSRAPSPSFTYASLYEPPLDASQYAPQPPPPGYVFYPQPPGASYLAPYPYYMSYGYPPTAPMPPLSDPPNPAGTENLYPPQHAPLHGPYMNPYMWTHSLPGHPPQQPPLMQNPTSMPATGPVPPPPSHSPSQGQTFPTYVPHYNTYPMPAYPHGPAFQPGMAPMTPPPLMHSQPMYMPEYANPTPMGHPNGNGTENNTNNHSRASSRSSGHGGSKRGVPRRAPWNHGPGASNGGYTYNTTGFGGGMGGNEAVGPRLSSRRISSGSGSAGNRTPGDEASSTASSSTTSSSSRQTYTSTSSKHPLPARPDWAVGLKPQPGLHPPRPHDHGGAGARMSPRIGPQTHLQHQAQPLLQATDFPPLPSAPERRAPVVGGAWTNTSSVRSILSPGPGSQGAANPHGSALVHYPNANANTSAAASACANMNASVDCQEEQESGYERPPPKGNAELFNPKGGSRPGKVAGKPREAAAGAGLAEQLDGLALEGPREAGADGERAPPAAEALEDATAADASS